MNNNEIKYNMCFSFQPNLRMDFTTKSTKVLCKLEFLSDHLEYCCFILQQTYTHIKRLLNRFDTTITLVALKINDGLFQLHLNFLFVYY